MMSNKKSKKSSKRNGSYQPTPLARYKQNKKILTPPLASLPGMVLSSWTNDRMPDMLWAVLIREHSPSNIGYVIFRDILGWLQKNSAKNEISGVTHTDIANFSEELRKKLIKHIVEQAGTDALKPLLLLTSLPAYDDWKEAMGKVTIEPDEGYNQLASAVSVVMFHQTQEATDVRWVKLMGAMLGGKLHMPTDMVDKILEYPNKYDQRSVRPFIRSAEMTIGMNIGDAGSKSAWPEKFWRYIQEETVCIPEISTKKEDVIKRYKNETEDKKFFNSILPEIHEALVFHTLDSSMTTGIDAKHETVFGLALYALNIFIENIILKVGGTSSGRVNARIIFETYITLRYLIEKEKTGETLWDAYRNYGIGQISLIDHQYKENNLNASMVDFKVMDDIANEDKWQEYVSINLGNWDASNLRIISMLVNEKDLYDAYYPYTSGFMHASWGAVRESSLQTCLNPLHRLHRIPTFGLPVLPSVNEDCRQMINKILKIVDELYPDFKYQIEKRPDSEPAASLE